MFERPDSGTRAVLVQIDFRIAKERGTREQEDIDEFVELALSTDIQPVEIIRGARTAPEPKYFIGTGKAEEIRDCAERLQADVVLFNHTLSPAQERNLEQLLKCRVVDRTGLILDIFARRARSFEGKLQVELAQLKHLSTRLVRGWTHLERQKGGIGLRGPGETQLETDRRLIRGRIKKLNGQLEKVSRQRDLRRKTRRKAAVKTISLVGYTNAGKSTLFNRLTGADVYAADQLFATLDPTLRRVELATIGHVILADTVGFIRHLPHDLVAAFRATLEETTEAHLLLHVVDADDEKHDENIRQVNQVLSEIGADSVPQIEVYNKIDLLDNAEPRIDRDANGYPTRVWLSAHTGAGIELLQQVLSEYFHSTADKSSTEQAMAQDVYWAADDHQPIQQRLFIPADAGRLRAKLYEWDVVLDEIPHEEGGWLINVMLSHEQISYLSKQEGCTLTSGNELNTICTA